MKRSTAIIIFLASVICLGAVLLMPAVAAKTTMTCEQKVAFLKDVNTQLGNIAESFRTQLEIATATNSKVWSDVHAVVKNAAKKSNSVKANKKAVTRNTKGCKPGRWRDPKHHNQCGRWGT